MKCVSWHLDTAGLFAASSPTWPSPPPPSATAICASMADARPRRASACCATQPWPAASDDMQAALDNAARAARAANARVRDITLPPVLAGAFRAHAIIQAYEAARALASEYERARDKLAKGVLELVESGFAISADAYDDARAHRQPGAPRAGRPDGRRRRDPVAVGAGRRAARASAPPARPTFNRLWTLMGTPCVNVPGLADPADCRSACR